MALTLSGIVRASDGKPLSGARVYIVDGPGAWPDMAALTDDDGRFALGVPGEGVYRVEAASDAGETRRIEIAAGGPDVRPVEVTLG